MKFGLVLLFCLLFYGSSDCESGEYEYFGSADPLHWLPKCEQCHFYCLTCNGHYITNCLTCHTDQFLSEIKTCDACHDNCKTCKNAEVSGCTSCENPKYFENGHCLDCPESNYLVIIDETTRSGSCYECHETCKTCFGVELHQCTTCPDDRIIFKNTCIECEKKMYLDRGTCKPCNDNCETCEFNSIRCTSCTAKQYLNDQYHCGDCNESCLTCLERSTKCTSCENGNLLLEDDTCGACSENQHLVFSNNSEPGMGPRGICIECTEREFLTITDNKLSAGFCRDCDESCRTCKKKANICTSCFEPKYLRTFTTSCEECNLVLTIYNDETRAGYCEDCDPTCAECEGTIHTCKLCITGRYFVDELKKCLACNKPCRECETNADTCTACLDGYYLNPTVFVGSKICEVCHSSCKTCDAVGPSGCDSCNVDFYLTTLNTCAECDKSKCYSCNGVTCLHCYKDYFLQNGLCIVCSQIQNCAKCNGLFCTKCSDGFTLINETQCDACEISNCKNCYENKLLKCSVCLDGFVKDGADCKSIELVDGCTATNGVLCANCKEGYKFLGHECEKCSVENCGNCKDSRGTCLYCKVGFYLNENICQENCIDDNCIENNEQDDHNSSNNKTFILFAD
ncbi:hypothetical protein A3Q56_02706 [Intoshia linei]|uniref:EGF-like domain-containing protein n=1 Tax=Intoshia linei TaxID=1819745 RepID=A0A177B794_9BILA|nr:hypothetical protein A3Q56_02706 [Intoshia linei]